MKYRRAHRTFSGPSFAKVPDKKKMTRSYKQEVCYNILWMKFSSTNLDFGVYLFVWDSHRVGINDIFGSKRHIRRTHTVAFKQTSRRVSSPLSLRPQQAVERQATSKIWNHLGLVINQFSIAKRKGKEKRKKKNGSPGNGERKLFNCSRQKVIIRTARVFLATNRAICTVTLTQVLVKKRTLSLVRFYTQYSFIPT